MFSLNKKLFLLFLFLCIEINLVSTANAGFENCIFCHEIEGKKFTLDITSLNNSFHGRINNENDLNYACYACHWNGTPSFNHPTNRSQIKTCEECHKGNLFNAPQVAEHIPSGQNISTSINCISCHRNSVDENASFNNTSDRVSHYGTTMNLISPQIRSNDCTWCHYDNSGNTTWDTPVDPRISITSLNHTQYSNNTKCFSCHVSGSGQLSSFHNSSMGKWNGGRDCISCHDIGGMAPKRVDFSASGDSGSIHLSLNSGKATSLDRNNLRCWACHGDSDGSEASQPSGGHPLNYKTPRNCNNNDCHSISQSNFKEPMIYSHFQNASKNNNPDNITNYNVTVSVQCQVCHINSIVKEENNSGLALVSHYGSKDKLIDSFNCVYCHLDEDKSRKWGNAILIQRNRTGLIKLEPEQNKFTVYEGERVYLGEGYFLKLVEIATARDVALIKLMKKDIVVDEFSLAAGDLYEYEQEVTIDNASTKIPIITINITSMFKGSRGLIQFEGYRSRKLHTDKESKNGACFACHIYRYFTNKERFLILDKENKDTFDNIFYTRIFVDMRPENKSKIYIDNDDYIFDQLENYSGKYGSDPKRKKLLQEGESWNITDKYSLKLNEVSTDSEVALLTLTIDGIIVDISPVRKGDVLKYTPAIEYKPFNKTNVTVFTANITGIFQGKNNFILLEDVVAISPEIMQISSNQTLFGYNSSWFSINDTFASGLIPSGLHSPGQYDNIRIWGDCVRCHDSSKNLRINNFDAISSKIGKHARLNRNASVNTSISDTIDKACWACHTGGTGPKMHLATYTTPRECRSCHIDQKEPFYGAIYVGDELHGNLTGCRTCHVVETHILKRFQVTPVIMKADLSRKDVPQGNIFRLTAKTVAGYDMRIRAAEYFIDEKGITGKGTPLYPSDRAFTSQNEKVEGIIETANLSLGPHILYVHAMERNNRWGEYYPVEFSVIEKEKNIIPTPQTPYPGVIYGLIAIVLSYLFLGRERK